MTENDWPTTPHIAFSIHELERKHMDRLKEDEKYEVAVAKQAGRDYTQDQYLRMAFLLKRSQDQETFERKIAKMVGMDYDE